LAEELAQDALVAALEHWPRDGLPDNPAAWLMTTAKNRALDHLRHRQMPARKAPGAGRMTWRRKRPWWCPICRRAGRAAQDDIGDDLLRLIFTACHPVLSTEARVA
jgi:predicted RNA polymerase sigma factor